VNRHRLGEQVRDSFGKIKRMNHWTIQEDGTRKLAIPTGVLAVDGNLIPLDTFTIAAVRLRVTRVRPKLPRQLNCE
jgi:hypothetical protein